MTLAYTVVTNLIVELINSFALLANSCYFFQKYLRYTGFFP